ncbi:MAG: 4-hydroxy-tetrahydrodipicolinate reductase, partial [Spirochaetota bacterium]
MSAFGICGISGRMGHALVTALEGRSLAIGAAFDAPDSPMAGKDPGTEITGTPSGTTVGVISDEGCAACDAVIDFSAPVATMALLDSACRTKTPLVIATTGFTDTEEARIVEASSVIPIVKSTNMSLGVNLMYKLIELAAGALPSGYDVEVFEAHHRYKKDSPSGTAKTMIQTVQKARKHLQHLEESYRGSGMTGPRSESEIGVQVLRGGGIVGEHTVYFVSDNDRIEITHRAGNRTILADGAVQAALFQHA